MIIARQFLEILESIGMEKSAMNVGLRIHSKIKVKSMMDP